MYSIKNFAIYLFHIQRMHITLPQLGLVADPVIEAIARLEFEDGLRTGVLPGGYWYPCGGRT